MLSERMQREVSSPQFNIRGKNPNDRRGWTFTMTVPTNSIRALLVSEWIYFSSDIEKVRRGQPSTPKIMRDCKCLKSFSLQRFGNVEENVES
jgi:hypothetical protein